MRRYLSDSVQADLGRKMVMLTGPRQVGKTTLARELMERYRQPQYLNWDVLDDRRIVLDQRWSRTADLLILDEIHKLDGWKAYLKGVFDGRPPGQAILVTGSARMETFRQAGESLAGRYFPIRLHPFSVREWTDLSGASPDQALDRLIERGGMPEPFLAEDPILAQRWRQHYFQDLIREDVLEFSRLQEVRAMKLLLDLLRTRVGSPLSLASLARDVQIAPNTLSKYLGILEALHILFLVRPFHRNVARAILKEPKPYFYDTGLVMGDAGIRWENALACHLLKWVEYRQDILGQETGLHYARTKEGHEVDFVCIESGEVTHLIECKQSDQRATSALLRFSRSFPAAEPLLLVRELRQEQYRAPVSILGGARWLASLPV